jgi:hypothetical protein
MSTWSFSALTGDLAAGQLILGFSAGVKRQLVCVVVTLAADSNSPPETSLLGPVIAFFSRVYDRQVLTARTFPFAPARALE